ncbi:MAG: hypothetical protein RIQ50_439, partial [Bacteroidota bacterium]
MVLTLSAGAQTFRLQGKVINTKNEPVAGASVVVEELKRTVVA